MVEECLTELRSLEEKAVEIATQYYDDTIQDINGLLNIGEKSSVQKRSRHGKPRGGPNLGPEGESLPIGEEGPELDGEFHPTRMRILARKKKLKKYLQRDQIPLNLPEHQSPRGQGKAKLRLPGLQEGQINLAKLKPELETGISLPPSRCAQSEAQQNRPAPMQEETPNLNPDNAGRGNSTRAQRRRERRRGRGPGCCGVMSLHHSHSSLLRSQTP